MCTMVEKTKNFNISLTTVANNTPAASQSGKTQQMRSELGTVIVDFELMPVPAPHSETAAPFAARSRRTAMP